MVTRFEICLPIILTAEGGYSNRPQDHGGATNCGITEANARDYGYGGDMRDIPADVVSRIYLSEYWNKVHAASVPVPADLVIFDAAVNEGVTEAVRQLQRAVGQQVDGIYGEHTAAAVSFANGKSLAMTLLDLRANFYNAIVAREPSQHVFLAGWLNRVTHLRSLL